MDKLVQEIAEFLYRMVNGKVGYTSADYFTREIYEAKAKQIIDIVLKHIK